MRLLAAPLLAALAGAGCAAQIDYAPLDPAPHAMTARTPESVEIFTGNEPARHHVMVGKLDMSDPSITGDALVRKLRYAAAQRGCDALLFTTATSRGATCLVYNDSGPDPAAKPLSEAPQHGGY
jgi:hypothetical protein